MEFKAKSQLGITFGLCVLFASSTIVVASSTPVPTTVPACPLAAVAPQTWSQDLEFGILTHRYMWYLNPCALGFPRSQTTCTDGTTGYFGQWEMPDANHGKCEQIWTNQTSPWTPFHSSRGEGYVGSFKTSAGNTANISIVCNLNHVNLTPIGNVGTSSAGGVFHYQVTLASNTVCGFPPPPSTTLPPQDDCSYYTTCKTCSTAPTGTCGFCAQTKSCVKGTSNGPISGSCPADKWEWYSRQCHNPV